MKVLAKKPKTRKETLKDKILTYKNLKEMMTQLDNELYQLRNEIINELGHDFNGTIDNVHVSIKEVITYRINTKQLKEQFPEVAVKVEEPMKTLRLTIR